MANSKDLQSITQQALKGVPAWLLKGIDQSKLKVVQGEAAKGYNHPAIASVPDDQPNTIVVHDADRYSQPGAATQILSHELTHSLMDKAAPTIKFAPVNQSAPYDYDANAVAGKKITDYSPEQLATMVQTNAAYQNDPTVSAARKQQIAQTYAPIEQQIQSLPQATVQTDQPQGDSQINTTPNAPRAMFADNLVTPTEGGSSAPPTAPPPPPPGFQMDSSATPSGGPPPPPEGFTVDAPTSSPADDPQGQFNVDNPSDGIGTKILKGVNAIGGGAGESLLHTVNSAGDLVGLHSDVLKSREQELANDNANNPLLRGGGYGFETLTEFMLGDEALKGLSTADQLLKVSQTMKILQNSPRLIAALKMGASAGKAIDTLSPAEQAIVRNSPVLTKLIGAGMDALRAGAVQGGESFLNDDSTLGDRVKTGASDALKTAGTAAVLGGAGSLIGHAGETAAKVGNLNKATEGASSKEQVAADLATRIGQSEQALHQNYENGINDLSGRLKGAEIDAQDNSLSDKAKELLQKPTPEDHPTLVAADKAAGAKLDKQTVELLQQIADGTQPLTPEEEEAAEEAAKAAKQKPSGLVGPDGKPVSSGAEPEEKPLDPARPYNIDDLVKIRQRIRQAATQYEPGDPNARVLKKLLYDNTDKSSAMDDTIESLAQQSGDDTATQDYRDLRANYRDKISAYDNNVIDKLREGKVDDAAKYFVGVNRTGSALPSGGEVRNNTADLQKVLGTQGLKNFGKQVFGTIMKDSTDKTGFNAAKFMDTMGRINDETKNGLFDFKTANSGLRQIYRDAQSAANIQHLTRVGVLVPAATVAGGAFGHIGAGIGTILGLTVAEGGGIAKGRELLDYVANHPAVWGTYRAAGRAISSPVAKVASAAVKNQVASTSSPSTAARNVYNSVADSLR